MQRNGAEGGTSIVRELHVYGTAVPVHGRDPTKFQHQVCERLLVMFHVAEMHDRKGFGTLLMEEAERIAREEHGSVKLAVISGKCGHMRKQSLLLTFAPSERCGHARLLSKIRVRAGGSLYE